MSSSKGGKPVHVRVARAAASARNASPGCSSSSSYRSFVASSGSKNAIGSATWIVTGRPSSPAVAHSGSSRGSSTGDEPPGGVARAQPEQLPDLQPARARSGGRAQSGRLHLAEVGALGPHRVVEPGEHGHPVAEGRPVLELACERVAPAAVEVHDRRDVRRVERGRERSR